MKKIIALAVVMGAAMAFATAQVTGLVLGVRGVYSYSAGTSVDDDCKDFLKEYLAYNEIYSDSSDVESSGKSGGGFALFMRFPLGKQLGVQAELAYTYNAVELEFSNTVGGYTGRSVSDCTFHTMSVPLLLTYNVVQNDRFFVTPFGGIQLAKPIGKTEVEGFEVYSDSTTPILFSFVVGASATVNFGRFGLVGDIRYNIGLNSIKASGITWVTPRALQLSAGFQYML